MSAPIDQLPPHNRDAERALLGSILRDQTIIDEALALVRADDFYVVGHGFTYRAMMALAEKGKEIDIVTVAEQLGKDGKLDDAGGYAYLVELWDSAPSAAHWRHYSGIILDRSLRRGLIHASTDATAESFDLGQDATDVIAGAERNLAVLTERGVQGDAVTMQTALSEAYKRLDARRAAGDVVGVPTGFVDLDSLLCGFRESELIIVGARPSTGKTAFGINVIRHAAVDCGIPTLFVSLEQSRTELTERLLCAEGKIDSHRLRRGYLHGSEETDLLNAGERIGPAPLWFDDASVQNMTRIAACARRMKRKKGIKFLVIDYLQLIDTDRSQGANRQEQVAHVSRRLKAIARDLKIPVVALCQVNRGPEDRQNKEPRLSDLRESGAIEQDADTVILLHRTDSLGVTDRIETIVAKQRNGPTGRAELIFDKRYMRFFNAEHHSSAT